LAIDNFKQKIYTFTQSRIPVKTGFYFGKSNGFQPNQSGIEILYMVFIGIDRIELSTEPKWN